MPLLTRRTITQLALLAALAAPAAEANDRALQKELETAYRAWREATIAKNYSDWVQATSPYRTAVTRNLVISQKLVWPGALFDIPVVPPHLTQLTLLRAKAVGDTAQLAYIGPVDFGVVQGDIPHNVLVIHLHRHGGKWRYDRSQFINLQANPEIGKEARKGGTAFLDGHRYAPTGKIEAPPKPCPKPDYIGHMNVVSYGYKTTIHINGTRHKSVCYDTVATDVIIGGLKPGENSISIVTEPVGDSTAEQREFAVSVFATHDIHARTPVRIFNYVPQQAPPSIRSGVWVTPTTLQGR